VPRTADGPGEVPHPEPEQHSPSASASARNTRHKCSYRTAYNTVRPRLSASTTPARASNARCRETTEKSTPHHSATSPTEHPRAHVAKHANSRARVGSAKALKSSGSSSTSSGPPRRPACLGFAGGRPEAAVAPPAAFRPGAARGRCVRICVMMQVLHPAPPRSSAAESLTDARLDSGTTVLYSDW